MNKPSRQQEIILSHLRSGKWVCGSAWLNGIKDDRARITSLNRGYMLEKGFRIIGEPCRGRACGNAKCPLFMRKAVRTGATANPAQPQPSARAQRINQEALAFFENYQPTTNHI